MCSQPSERIALRFYYAAVFGALGAYLPFFPTWLEARGIRGVAMGAVLSLLPAMGVAGPPAFGFVADALGLRGWLLRVGCLGASAAFVVIATAGAADLPLGFGAVFAAVSGAFMYFATLTEVPILQGLIHSGMGKGPALALLLAGPALSLPNMLVIRSVMGTRKTLVFVSLVVVMATVSGLLFGLIAS